MIFPRLQPINAAERSFVRHGHKNIWLQNFFCPVETFRGHANDGVGLLVNADQPSHDVGICFELTLPGRPGNHGRLRGSRMIIIGTLQQAAKERLNANHLEILPADFASPDRAGGAIGFESKIFDSPCGHRRKNCVCIQPGRQEHPLAGRRPASRTSRRRRASGPTRSGPTRTACSRSRTSRGTGWSRSVDNEHKTPFLAFGVLDAIPYYWLLLTVLLIVLRRGHPDQGEPGRPRLGGHPRGRGRRRADGGADVPLQAPGLRAGRRDRRPGRLDAGGRPGRLHQPRRSFPLLLSMLFVAAVIIGGAGNRWGAVLGGVLVAYLPERFRALSDWRLLIFGREPDGDRDVPASGPAATTADPSRDAGAGRDRGAGRGGPSMPDTDTRKALLEVDDVTIRFGGVTALDQVSFDIKEGEILGLIGPNGAGQDHLLQRDDRRLPGDQRPDPLRRQPLAKRKRHDITKLGIARTFQNIRLFKVDDRPGERHGRRRRAQQGRSAQRAVPHAAAPPHRGGRGGGGRTTCSSSSASPGARTSWPRTSPTATSVGSRSPGRWRPSRSCCASTSRPPASTRRRSSA